MPRHSSTQSGRRIPEQYQKWAALVEELDGSLEEARQEPAQLLLVSVALWLKSPAVLAESSDRKSTRLNSSHRNTSRMPSSA